MFLVALYLGVIGMPTGKVSWFGGPHDSMDSGHTANGQTTATPGIAIYNRSTLNGYWRVRFPNGRTLTLKQTDIGPHPSTGRKVDVTYSALRQAGYSEHNFPTDAPVQYSYLGKNPKGGTAPQQASKPAPGTTRITKTVTPGVDNSALRNQLKFNYLSKAPASPFSAQALTPAKPLTDPLKALSAPPSAPDPVKYLGQANAKTSALLSLAGNLRQAADVAPVTKTFTQTTPGQAASSGGGSGGGYRHPIPGASISSHDNGADFETHPGTPLRAVGSGKVVNTQGAFPGGSIVIQLDHPYHGFRYVYYGHLNNNNKEVHVGQRVSPGQIIARTSHSPAGASDMPGHTEIGFARGANGAIETGGHYSGNRSVGSSYGQAFARFLRGLR